MSPEISTRRIWGTSGVVHEMASLGVGTMCGRQMPEPWDWTNRKVTCRNCRLAMKREARELREWRKRWG